MYAIRSYYDRLGHPVLRDRSIGQARGGQDRDLVLREIREGLQGPFRHAEGDGDLVVRKPQGKTSA